MRETREVRVLPIFQMSGGSVQLFFKVENRELKDSTNEEEKKLWADVKF